MQQQTLQAYQSSAESAGEDSHPLCQVCHDAELTGTEYRDEELLRHLYHDHGLTQEEMVVHVSCTSRTTIRKWMGKTGVETSSYQYEMPEEELRELYLDKDLSINEIADHYGCSYLAVRNRLTNHDIPLKPPGYHLSDGECESRDFSREERLRELYHEDGLSKAEIAEQCGVAAGTVQYWMDRFDIEARDYSEAQTLRRKKLNEPYQDEYLLYTLYWEHGLNTREIADRLGCSQLAVTTWMNKYDIQFRYAGAHGNTYETDRGEYVRSAHERQIANWLHEHGLDYEYEPDIDSPMTPDFLVDGVYIEHWGMVNRDDYCDRMEEKRSLYAELDIDVIGTFPDDLDDLSEKLGCLTN